MVFGGSTSVAHTGPWKARSKAQMETTKTMKSFPMPVHTLTAEEQIPVALGKKAPTQPPVKPHFVKSAASTPLLDGFLLLDSCGVESPEDAVKAVIQGMGIFEVAEEDLKYFKNLSFLDLAENLVQFEHLAKLPSLVELRLQCNQLVYIQIPNVSFVYLEVLDLSYNQIDTQFIEELARLPRLRKLDLGCNELKELHFDGSFFTSLEELSLHGNHLNDSSIWFVLATLPRLLRLDLSSNKITEVAINALDHGGYEMLQELDLSHNLISDEERLLPLREFAELRKVIISGNPLLKKSSLSLLASELVEAKGMEIAIVPDPPASYLRKKKTNKNDLKPPYPPLIAQVTDDTVYLQKAQLYGVDLATIATSSPYQMTDLAPSSEYQTPELHLVGEAMTSSEEFTGPSTTPSMLLAIPQDHTTASATATAATSGTADVKASFFLTEQDNADATDMVGSNPNSEVDSRANAYSRGESDYPPSQSRPSSRPSSRPQSRGYSTVDSRVRSRISNRGPSAAQETVDSRPSTALAQYRPPSQPSQAAPAPSGLNVFKELAQALMDSEEREYEGPPLDMRTAVSNLRTALRYPLTYHMKNSKGKHYETTTKAAEQKLEKLTKIRPNNNLSPKKAHGGEGYSKNKQTLSTIESILDAMNAKMAMTADMTKNRPPVQHLGSSMNSFNSNNNTTGGGGGMGRGGIVVSNQNNERMIIQRSGSSFSNSDMMNQSYNSNSNSHSNNRSQIPSVARSAVGSASVGVEPILSELTKRTPPLSSMDAMATRPLSHENNIFSNKGIATPDISSRADSVSMYGSRQGTGTGSGSISRASALKGRVASASPPIRFNDILQHVESTSR